MSTMLKAAVSHLPLRGTLPGSPLAGGASPLASSRDLRRPALQRAPALRQVLSGPAWLAVHSALRLTPARRARARSPGSHLHLGTLSCHHHEENVAPCHSHEAKAHHGPGRCGGAMLRIATHGGSDAADSPCACAAGCGSAGEIQFWVSAARIARKPHLTACSWRDTHSPSSRGSRRGSALRSRSPWRCEGKPPCPRSRSLRP